MIIVIKQTTVNFFISSCAGRKICMPELFSYVRFNVYLVLRETLCDFFYRLLPLLFCCRLFINNQA